MSKESFELDSGLPTDYVVIVENAEFGYREHYQSGDTPLLIWHCKSPQMEPREELWSIGAGWEVAENGLRVEGKPRFPASSWFGRLIVRCAELDMPGYDGKVLDFIAERGVAQEANIWIGLKFLMTREELDFGPDFGKRTHIMPTQCFGLVEEGAEIEEAEAWAEGDTGAGAFDEPPEVQPQRLEQPTSEPDTSQEDGKMLALLRPFAEKASSVIEFQSTAVSNLGKALGENDKWLGRMLNPEGAAELYAKLRE